MQSTNADTQNDTCNAFDNLTRFQIDLLAVLGRESAIRGTRIKSILETQYDTQEVHHGRMYPNLDELVEKGLVEKGEIDKRTNSYELTDEGRDLLYERARVLAIAAGKLIAEPAAVDDATIEQIQDDKPRSPWEGA